ncbi:hypothetical protein LRS13_13595 [Svornostia abyssi]|uniref:Uncharacterized protein n=1 Tax=Svornostia abyssi TaxID=2898438 RepID=A0ABY5PAZ0_9ACTN|nr:hypothetical protein LRS13_13595 [Parviterribacteraceae bacterium J379]
MPRFQRELDRDDPLTVGLDRRLAAARSSLAGIAAVLRDGYGQPASGDRMSRAAIIDHLRVQGERLRLLDEQFGEMFAMIEEATPEIHASSRGGASSQQAVELQRRFGELLNLTAWAEVLAAGARARLRELEAPGR